MLDDKRAPLGCFVLQTSPEERDDRPGLWRGVFDNDIHCGLGCLRHDLLCETSHPQEVGKHSINVGVESSAERHRELVVKRTSVRRNYGSQTGKLVHDDVTNGPTRKILNTYRFQRCIDESLEV